ncbi:Beta-propeller repeat protein [Xenococcus sp. PCC 7305]|uniref:SBBP repeat-containing protein n=1 Tax=Xenococcus sp. PCC 7305 TaxID=102125 RepID=UPI0002AD0680|nr:SBBP repeat-containing protein [Xenococcus sp. PCC 7305]ELS01647.1 Beta-propeller repeat protein [Xenococcus sp. PCC 7305]
MAENLIMWIKQLGSPENDLSQGIAIDSNGNVFISGSTRGTLGNTNFGNSDTWVAKYDHQGNLLWTQQFGTSNLDDFEGLATDINGHVYIAGSSLGTIEGTFQIDSDAWVNKYDGQGNLLWSQQLGFSGFDSATGVATDLGGNVYISGFTNGISDEANGGGSVAWVTKYDVQGNLLWNQQLDASGSEISAGVTTDIHGNFYISGDTTRSNSENTNAWVAKYDAEGNLLWNQQLDSAEAEFDYSQAVTTDLSGNVYIAGGTNGSIDRGNAGLNDAWVAKYDGEGNLLWTEQLGTVGNDAAEGITTDSEGNVYISGFTNETLGEANAGGSDAWVAKYDSNGNLLWTEQFGSPEDDDSQGVAIDSNGSLYLSGSTEGNLDGVNFGGEDAWVAQISQPIIPDNGGNGGNNGNGGGSAPLLTTPINRFQNNSLPGTYLFAGEDESQGIRANFPNFVEEGQAFRVGVEPGDNLIRLNRFQNSNVPGTYLYAGEEESQSIRANFSNFIEEGIAFYVYAGTADIGTDFYRFQNQNVPGTYIFVGGNERQNILANFPHFHEEGIAFEVGT